MVDDRWFGEMRPIYLRLEDERRGVLLSDIVVHLAINGEMKL